MNGPYRKWYYSRVYNGIYANIMLMTPKKVILSCAILHVLWFLTTRHEMNMTTCDSYTNCINYMYNQCLSPLKLWVGTRSWRGVLDTTLCDKVCQWLATGRRFSPGIPVSSINTIDRHDITEILLKVALNTINQTLNQNTTCIDIKF
jgi:hypothetical protein